MTTDTDDKTARRALALGFVAAAAGFLFLPVGDAIGKYLGESGMPAIQVGWGRWLFQMIFLFPVVMVLYRKQFWPIPRFWLQLARAGAMIGATVTFFWGIARIPLADATAVLFIGPLLVVVLSALILKEKVGPRRWIAVGIGFVGMLIIVRPGAAGFDPNMLIIVGTAFCFGIFLVLSRMLAGLAPTLLVMVWMGVLGVAVTTVGSIPVWVEPTANQWFAMLLLGAAMAFGHFLVLWASARLEASAMAVMPYLEIVSSTTIGFFYFDHFPDLLTWVGCSLIVAAGIFVVIREQRLNKQPVAPVDTALP